MRLSRPFILLFLSVANWGSESFKKPTVDLCRELSFSEDDTAYNRESDRVLWYLDRESQRVDITFSKSSLPTSLPPSACSRLGLRVIVIDTILNPNSKARTLNV